MAMAVVLLRLLARGGKAVAKDRGKPRGHAGRRGGGPATGPPARVVAKSSGPFPLTMKFGGASTMTGAGRDVAMRDGGQIRQGSLER